MKVFNLLVKLLLLHFKHLQKNFKEEKTAYLFFSIHNDILTLVSSQGTREEELKCHLLCHELTLSYLKTRN